MRIQKLRGRLGKVVASKRSRYPRTQARSLLSPEGPESIYKLFVEYTPVAVAMLDREMRYLLVSRRWMKDHQLESDIIGKSHYDVFPDLSPHGKEIHQRALTGTAQSYEGEEFALNGTTAWIKWEVCPWYNGDEIGGILISSEDISERQSAEAALKKSEKRLQAFMNHSPVSAWITDREGLMVYHSQTYREMFQIKVQESIGKTVFDLYESEIAIAFLENIRKVADTQQSLETIELAPRPDGTLGSFLVYKFPIPEAFETGLVGGVALDITERQKTEAALKDSEEQYRALADAMPQIIWTAQPDGSIDYHNQHWFDYTGMTPEQAQGWGWQSAIHPDDIQKCLEMWSQAVAKGDSYQSDEYRFRRASDGQYRWYLKQAIPMRDRQGQIVKWFGTCTDIDDQKRTEEALRESEASYRRLIETAHEGIWMLDLDNKTTFANSKMAEMLGYTPEEMLGKSVFDFIDAEEKAIGDRNVERRRQGISEQHDFKFCRKDGSDLWAMVATNPILDAEGQYIGALGMISDITDRRRAEQEVRALNAELEQRVKERTAQLEAANKELETFSYSVSHDLRSPLRGIDGFSQLLLNQYGEQLDDTGKHYLQRIRAGAQRLGELIDDLLTLSQVNRSEIHHTTVNLSALATEISAELQAIDPNRQIKLAIAPEIVAKGDRRLLRILLENLFNNAWKFTSKHPTAYIEFGVLPTSVAATQPIYFVRDDGAGFDMTYVHKLFGAFQRLHSATEFPGTGIGLATVSRIIHRHNGRIWAEAAIEQGATFYFTL